MNYEVHPRQVIAFQIYFCSVYSVIGFPFQAVVLKFKLLGIFAVGLLMYIDESKSSLNVRVCKEWDHNFTIFL